MKPTLFTLIAFLLFGQMASAQWIRWPDYYESTFWPDFYDSKRWSGFYFGLNSGYAWGNVNFRTTVPGTGDIGDYFDSLEHQLLAGFAKRRLHPSGFVGGVQAGYNWKFCYSPMVLGVETDFDAFLLKKSHHISAPFADIPEATIHLNRHIQTNWLYTLRARLGYSCNRWFTFVTGGLAVTNLRARQKYFDNFNTVDQNPFPDALEIAKKTTTLPGWTVGAGVEYAISRCLSAFVTYLYTHFRDIKFSGGFVAVPQFDGNIPDLDTFNNRVNLHTNMVRFGLNYKI